MSTGRYAFAFIAIVLLGCALVTYLTQPRDGAPIVVPFVLAGAALVAVFVAWYVGRFPTRLRGMREGEKPGHSAESGGHDE
jgi:hypothetical protein